MTPLQSYEMAMVAISGLGLLYLLFAEWQTPEYRSYVVLMTVGLLAFALAEPLAFLWFPDFRHVIHGAGLLFILLGLFGLVSSELETADWAGVVSTDPTSLRQRQNWMVPLDDRILSLFNSTHLVLTPTIIAYNLDYSREEVNRRLTDLSEHGLVERVERGKYRLTTAGEAYLRSGPTYRTAPAPAVSKEAD